jgi:hypothetical protein
MLLAPNSCAQSDPVSHPVGAGLPYRLPPGPSIACWARVAESPTHPSRPAMSQYSVEPARNSILPCVAGS